MANQTPPDRDLNRNRNREQKAAGPDSANRPERPREGSGSSARRGAAPSTRRPVAESHVQPRRAERRPEMVKQRRDDRRKHYDRRKRQWLYTRIGLGAVGALAVAALLWTAFSYAKDKNDNTKPTGVKEYAYAGGEHLTKEEPQTVPYTESPPVGGKHDAVWQNCGYYPQAIRNENAVHSMEHGAIWITYRPDLQQDQVDQLKKLAKDDTYVLVSPYASQQEAVVMSAWNNQLRLDAMSDKRFDQFVKYYRQGPQTPERGAACTGGTGTPA
jgi:hypothetical protein